jgi:hypothetical protein
MNFKHLLGTGMVVLVVSACGSDPEPADSFGAIAAQVEKPTGVFASDNALKVAEEFGKIRGLGANGTRPQGTSSSTSIACGAGGTYSITSSATSQSSAHAVLTYDDCCYVASCCMNGKGDWYYAASAGQAFSYCGSYDVSYDCSGVQAAMTYSGCFNASGEWTYVVEVDSMTFAVSGTYYSGSGTLEVTAANGSWTCTFTNSSGTCTGTSSIRI